MPYTLAEAAQATGCNRTTILRAIKSGRVSGTRNDAGAWQVEAVELHRIFPAQQTPSASHHVAQADSAALDAQIAMLREHLAEVRADRDEWRAQAQRLALAGPIVTPAPVRRSWWRKAG